MVTKETAQLHQSASRIGDLEGSQEISVERKRKSERRKKRRRRWKEGQVFFPIKKEHYDG